jgi:hypothetical protein
MTAASWDERRAQRQQADAERKQQQAKERESK